MCKDMEVISVTTPRNMRWVRHVACVRETINLFNISVGKTRGYRNVKVDRRMIIKVTMLRVKLWTGFMWLRIVSTARLFFVHGNEPSGCVTFVTGNVLA